MYINDYHKGEMMKTLLLGHDTAPSMALTAIAEALPSRSYELLVAFGREENRPSKEAIAVAVAKADVVLLGMSSSTALAEDELFTAHMARRLNRPYGLFSDIHGCHRRPHLAESLANASFLFVINEEERADARTCFPLVYTVASGSPVWEKFAFPARPAEEVRDELGLDAHDLLFVVPGGKDGTINCELVRTATLAVAQARSDCGVESSDVLTFIPNPGDLTDPHMYVRLVQEINYDDVACSIVLSDKLLTKPAWRKCFVTMERDWMDGTFFPLTFAHSEVLSACQNLRGVVVQSASTIGIEAGHLHVPVINYFTEYALDRLERATSTRLWKPVEQGVESAVFKHSYDAPYVSVARLAQKIRELTTEQGFAPMREAQERIYPVPHNRGQSVSTIIDVLGKYGRPSPEDPDRFESRT